ncbi:hypothetical protein GCM10008097_01500 [Mycetocola manganoxydans]|nr:hypothetical protein GCM10008097_01500 [Mycetocola manganoxydans]
MGEPGLGLIAAHLSIAALTLGTVAAGADERDGDALTDSQGRDAGAEFADPPDQFVPGDVRKRDAGIMSCPRVHIALAQAGGQNLDDDGARPGRGLFDVDDAGYSPK